MRRKRIKSLDSLKGIACIIIACLWHYQNMQPRDLGMPMQSVFEIFYLYGQYFVELFFMISGFVMAYCYRNKIEDGEYFLTYISKRYKHLYPLFFVTLMYISVFQAVYSVLSGGGGYYVYQVSVWHFVLNLLCIQTGWLSLDQSFNGPAWCISVEIFLYILFFITTRLSKNDKNNYIIINGVMFVCATIIVYLQIGNIPIINQYMMRGVSCFYAGVIIQEINEWLDEDRKRRFVSIALIFFVIFRLLLHLSPNHGWWENENNGRIALIILEWPLLILASINVSWFRKMLEIKPLQYMGKISMDVFLWHIPVQITIKTLDMIFELKINYGSISIWVIYIILVLLVSSISNVVSEKVKHCKLLGGVLTGKSK